MNAHNRKVVDLERPLLPTRRDSDYRKNSLAEDFRDIRNLVYPGDTRILTDIRR